MNRGFGGLCRLGMRELEEERDARELQKAGGEEGKKKGVERDGLVTKNGLFLL